MKKGLAYMASVALSLGVLPGAQAAIYTNGSASAQFNVTLALQADCSIAADPLDFGTTGVLGTALNQTTTITVTCTNTTPYNIGLDGGTVANSTVDNRLMAGTSSGDTVSFQLYQDAAHSSVWGNTQDTDTVGAVGTGVPQAMTVYGQVPAQDTPAPDTYLTTVTATVYF